ncbi:hypothetical protein L1987_14914 [Smallanthus sonchifolius]|uniref:Uncharacterized protein n=1 Tax=Smallanthus sonchifolius TaxID=185202 RepID=A0ACB9J6D7_9ASTR|nr:hypothetical protein L1987_14914 [Smallanthus sonchifolius]
MLRQLHIHIPFVKALSSMPKYAKYLKDMLTNKTKLEALSTMVMNERYSAVIEPSLPQKMKDPGSFTIPCARPRRDAADTDESYPHGFVENMLVRVDKFIFPVDFVILVMDEDEHVPLILGRPFLATVHEMIDVFSGKLTLGVNDEKVTFDVNKSMKHPSSQDDTLYFIESIMSHMGEFLRDICGGDASDTQILTRENDEIEKTVAVVIESSSPLEREARQDPTRFEGIERSEPVQRPSVESPPSSLELKELPSHLDYAFLDDERKLPVIIVVDLTGDEKERLTGVLKAHKHAIAWKLMDIKGINPSFCTHKILMEDDYKSVVLGQRRLNPKILEVVKKEVLKLLDAGLIYPISDFGWVSLVQVVPKKGGMTVVVN